MDIRCPYLVTTYPKTIPVNWNSFGVQDDLQPLA